MLSNLIGKSRQRLFDAMAACGRETAAFVRRHELNRPAAIFCIIAVTVTVVAPIGQWMARESVYRVSPKAAALLPAQDSSLAQKLNYDSKAHTYSYQANTKNTNRVAPPYTASLPNNASQGISITDTKSKLAVSLVPLFPTDQARPVGEQNKVIYPITSGGQMIYSSDQNGLKEDIVLNNAPSGGKVDYAYQLNMSAGMTAKLLKNGEIGIYKSGSTTPQYTLPAPIVKQAASQTPGKMAVKSTKPNASKSATSKVKAWFELSGNVVHLKATGLNTASYPVSIDPSIFDTFWSYSYPVDIDNDCGYSAFASSGSYVYALGGQNCTDSLDRGTALYAHYNGDGSLSTWQYTSDFSNIAPTRSNATAIVSNGYLYLIGGTHRQWDVNTGGWITNNLMDALYAHINGDGSLGAWQQTSAFGEADLYNVGPAGQVEVNNGYMYLYAGSVLVSPIGGDGSLGEWQSTGLGGNEGFIANGNLYSYSGNSFYVAPINGDGTLGDVVDQGNIGQYYPADYRGSKMLYDADNNYVYLLNGYYQDDAYSYKTLAAHVGNDGVVGMWSPVPYPPMWNADGFWLHNGRLYAGGGSYVAFADINIEDEGGRDCDTNSIIYCGAYTKAELMDKLSNGDTVHSGSDLVDTLHSYYVDHGMTGPDTYRGPGYIYYDMLFWTANAVSGRLYVNGDIYVGDKLMATGAQPCGREKFLDTDYQSGSLWCRLVPNFAAGTEYLDVWVFISTFYIDRHDYTYHQGNGTFIGAIMKPCGNPVSATSTGVSVTPNIPTPPTEVTPSPSGSVTPHSCCEMTDVSVGIGSHLINDTTPLNFSWKTGTTAKVLSVKIELCQSANLTGPCQVPPGSSMSGASLTSMGGEFSGGWPTVPTSDSILLRKDAYGGGINYNGLQNKIENLFGIGTAQAAGDSEGDFLTAGATETIDLAGFVNPSTAGTYYFRITTYSTSDAYYSGIIDCGIAAATFTDESEPTPSPSGPPQHNCCQLIQRSVTLGSSVVSASTTADFSWKRTGDPATIKAVQIQVCTTTSYTDPCTKPTDADMSAVTLAFTGGELGASGWSLSVLDDHTVLITKSAGAATMAGVTETVGLAGFVNPSVYGSFNFRISTYDTVDADYDDAVDCGTVTTSTAKSITTTADVSEMLVFRVANEVASNCASQTDIADPNDTSEDLVTLSPDPMSLTTAATSTAQFCIVTNAGGGYVIAYRDEALGGPSKGFWNGAHEFPVVTSFTSTPGTEQFGFNLRANTVPVFGADPDAAGLVADLTNPQYSTVNQYSYDDTGTSIVLASKVAPSASARYTLAYLANISSLTPGGTYQSHQVFVATATF